MSDIMDGEADMYLWFYAAEASWLGLNQGSYCCFKLKQIMEIDPLALPTPMLSKVTGNCVQFGLFNKEKCPQGLVSYPEGHRGLVTRVSFRGKMELDLIRWY